MNTIKNIWRLVMMMALAAFITSCEDEIEVRKFPKAQGEFAVTTSATTVAVPATDSLATVLSFSWQDPKYTTGLENTRFSVRFAKSGTNFSKVMSKDFTGVLTGAVIGRDLNGIALALGGTTGETIKLDVMVVASHMNNNEPKSSNVIQVNVTPFADLALSASAASVVLSSDTPDLVGLDLEWSTAFNGFSAVKIYKLQYAQGGSDFANATSIDVTGYSKMFTHADLNDIALGYAIAPGSEGDVDFRVWAKNQETGEEVYSNVVTVSLTPYATDFPSIFGMGDALKGWGPWPDNAVEFVSNEFKKYEGYAYFTNGKAFRFFNQLNWGPTSYNYPYFTSVDANFENANDNDSNFKFIGASGWYKVNVDLLAGSVTLSTSSEPLLYMTGQALNGWNWTNHVQLTYVKPGVFTATATFTNNETFRFFAQADWNPTSYNYEYFESVDPLFVNGNDGDKNLRYVGPTGVKTITVNFNNSSVNVGDLYMTGEALNGWNWDNPVRMLKVAPDTYEAIATFKTDKAFRFFAQADWGPISYNYPHFSKVDENFVNANDGDSNLKFVGVEGSYTIRVNLATKVVSLD